MPTVRQQLNAPAFSNLRERSQRADLKRTADEALRYATAKPLPKRYRYVAAPKPKPFRVSPRRVGTDVPKRFESSLTAIEKRDRAKMRRQDERDLTKLMKAAYGRGSTKVGMAARQRLVDRGSLPGETSVAKEARYKRTMAARAKRRYPVEEAVGKARRVLISSPKIAGTLAKAPLSTKGSRIAVGRAMGAIASGPTTVRVGKSGRLATAPSQRVNLSAAEAERVGKIGLNVGKDAIDLPAQTVLSAYYTAKPAGEALNELRKGNTKKAAQKAGESAKSIYEPYVELAKNPEKSFEEHPLVTYLMVAGAKGALGRGIGKGLRVAPSKRLRKAGAITGREPARVRGTNITVPRYYSKDALNKAVQIAYDRRQRKKGKKPTVSARQIARRADSTMARNEGVRKVNRTATIKANKEAVGKNATAATRLAAERIITGATPEAMLADLKAYRTEVAKSPEPSTKAKKVQRETLLSQIDDAIANFDGENVRKGAEAYVELSKRLQDRLVELKIIEPERASRARVMPYAVRKMGARYDFESGALLREGGQRRPLKEINKEITQTNREVRQAQSRVKRAELSAMKAPPRSTPGLRQAERELRDAELTYRKRRAEDRRQRGEGSRKRSKALSRERKDFLEYLRKEDPNYLELEKERGAVNKERRAFRVRLQNREVLTKPERKEFADLSRRSRKLTEQIKEIEASTKAPKSVLRSRRASIGALVPETKSLKRRNEAQANVRRARQKVEREKKAARKLVATETPRRPKRKITDEYGNEIRRTPRKGWVEPMVVDDYGTVVRGPSKRRSAADRLVDAIAQERAVVRKKERLKAEREAFSETVLTTDEIKAQMLKETGADDAAFLTQAPSSRGARNYFVAQTQAPSIGGRRRSGEAVRQGIFDADPVTMEESAVRAQGLIDAAEGWKRMVDEASYREGDKIANFENYADAMEAARGLQADGVGTFRPVKLTPFQAKKEQLDFYLSQTEEGAEINLVDGLADATAKNPTDKTGPWVLMPDGYAARVNDHMKHIGRGNAIDPAGQAFGNLFRPVVLATSPKWLVGNVVEAGLRSTVAHAGPRSYFTMRKILKQLEKENPEYAALITEEMLGGGHYAMSDRVAVKVTGERFPAESKSQKAVVALEAVGKAPGIRLIPQAWHHYTNFVMNTVNRSIERQFQTAMAGKRVRETLITDRLNKLSNEAIQQAADGLLDMNTVVALGKEVDRMYGRYSKFSPSERYWISTYTPFVRWALNAVRFVFDVMPRDHPVLTAMLASSYAASEDWRKSEKLSFFVEDALPGFLQGSIPGKEGSHLRIARYTPFGAFADGGSIMSTFGNQFIPQFMGVIEATQGRDWTGAKLDDDSIMGRLEAATLQLFGATIPFFSLVESVKKSDETTIPKRLRARLDPFKFTPAGGKQKNAGKGVLVLDGGASPAAPSGSSSNDGVLKLTK